MYAIRDNTIIEANRVSLRTISVYSDSSPIGFFLGVIMVKVKVQNGFHVIFNCQRCGVEKRRPYRRYMRAKNRRHFCSRECSDLFQKEHVRKKRNPTSRSKITLEEQVLRTTCREKLWRKIKTGKIQKQPCGICGEKGQAHHPDYNKPYDVEWLCDAHHRERHLNLRRLLHTAQRKDNDT